MCLSCVMSLVTSRVIPQWSTESAGPGSVQLSSCPTRGPLLWVTSIPNRAPWFWTSWTLESPRTNGPFRRDGQMELGSRTDTGQWGGCCVGLQRRWSVLSHKSSASNWTSCALHHDQAKRERKKGGRDGECGEGTERGEVRSWVRTSTQHSCHNWYVIQLHTTAA